MISDLCFGKISKGSLTFTPAINSHEESRRTPTLLKNTTFQKCVPNYTVFIFSLFFQGMLLIRILNGKNKKI